MKKSHRKSVFYEFYIEIRISSYESLINIRKNSFNEVKFQILDSGYV